LFAKIKVGFFNQKLLNFGFTNKMVFFQINVIVVCSFASTFLKFGNFENCKIIEN